MTINDLRYNKSKISSFKHKATVFFASCFLLLSSNLFAQVTSSIDSTSIKIGEQITYKIQVETDSTNLVVFPEGQTFSPLEMIESYKIDTTKNDAKFKLIKKYGLTQFDSGAYTIPRQKIIIGTKTFFTDSLKVEVNNIVVDTTKQGLYDIKPIIGVEKSSSNWWKYLLYTLLALALIAFLLYWFIWRKKPLTEDQKVALLPPYDRAKLALQQLDESNYLINDEIKEYYSDLTLIIRKYLDEKVYNRALESTTDQLIDRLNLLRDGNQIDLDKKAIKNIESILKRADLVKFAKSAPDNELAKLDRKTIDLEIDHVKEALPEPSEEEKLLNLKYKEEQERKKKRRKIILTVAISVFLLIATVIGFGVKYGFRYVKDTIIGHETKELLEGNWVTSDYGFPPISIATPRVLKRIEAPIPDELKEKVKISMFAYGSLIDKFNIVVATTQINQPQQQTQGEKNEQENKIDLNVFIEGNLKTWENKGVQNIITISDKFTTPNGAEGIKTHGTADFPSIVKDKFDKGKYTFLSFTTENVVQQIVLMWKADDVYADDIIKRIIDSIELQPKTEEE